jgi:hypothetical protein
VFDEDPVDEYSLSTALHSQMQQYIGNPQLEDILGLMDHEEDVGPSEAEYGGEPIELTELNAPGALGEEGQVQADPAEDEQVRSDMRDMMAERAKARLAASESFQTRAKQILG